MNNTRKIQLDADKALNGLISLFSSIPQEQINKIPFKDSWTAGQLAKHMVMANAGFADVINGPVKETERAPDEMAGKIKADFLNFNIHMESPEFLIPPKAEYHQEELVNALDNIRVKLNENFEALDLSKTCLAFELPVYGHLTRFEAVTFIIYHTQRHIHQLKNIIKQLNTNLDHLQFEQ